MLELRQVLKSKIPSQMSDVAIEEIRPHPALGTIYICRTKWDNVIRFTEAELKEYFDIPANLCV